MPENNINLKLLIEGCLRKNRNSQRKLYEHFYGYGMNVCLRYSKNRDEALEILNDSFLKVFSKLEQYDPSYPFKGWLRRILVNSAIDYHRVHHKNPAHLELNTVKHLADPANTYPVFSNDRDVLPLIQQLSPAYRMVFNLYVMEGYKHHEIAEKLGISVGTSKSNLKRAKDNLRTLLGAEDRKAKNG